MGLNTTPSRDLTDIRRSRLKHLARAVSALADAEAAVVDDLTVLDGAGSLPSPYGDAGTWNHPAEATLLDDLKHISDRVLGLRHRLKREQAESRTKAVSCTCRPSRPQPVPDHRGSSHPAPSIRELGERTAT